MREIKFRIYFNFFDDGYMDFPHFIKNGGKTIIYDGDEYEVGEEIKLMQYTEQNDTLGNEIYEDDFIIEMSEDGDYYLKLIGFGYDDREYTSILKGFKITKGIQLDIYFDENKFQGKHAYLIEKYNLKIQKSICDEWIDYQVVGNVHQNPELLELF